MSKYVNNRMKVIYFILFGALGALFPFLTPYLRNELNLTGQQIGLILSVGPLISILFVPLFGLFSDKVNKPKTVLICVTLLLAIIILGLSYAKAFFIVFIIVIINDLTKSSLFPLLTNYVLSVPKEYGVIFSKIRNKGSIGYAIFAFIMGYLITFTGMPKLFMYVFVILMIISAILLWPLPEGHIEEDQTEHDFKKEVKIALKNKNFIVVLLISSFIMALGDTIHPFVSLGMSDLGASSLQIGLTFLFMAGPEYLVFPLTERIYKQVGYFNLFLFVILMAIIRFIVYALTGSIVVFTIFSTIHAITFAISNTLFVKFINDNLSNKISTSAISISSSIRMGTVSIVTLISGTVYDILGIQYVYLFCAGLAFILLIYLLISKNKILRIN